MSDPLQMPAEIRGLDVFNADPEDARIAVREELYRILEQSDGGDQIAVDYSELWRVWRLSCVAALRTEYTMPLGMALAILVLLGVTFAFGVWAGVVVG